MLPQAKTRLCDAQWLICVSSIRIIHAASDVPPGAVGDDKLTP
jgi:hypothetical protein